MSEIYPNPTGDFLYKEEVQALYSEICAEFKDFVPESHAFRATFRVDPVNICYLAMPILDAKKPFWTISAEYVKPLGRIGVTSIIIPMKGGAYHELRRSKDNPDTFLPYKVTNGRRPLLTIDGETMPTSALIVDEIMKLAGIEPLSYSTNPLEQQLAVARFKSAASEWSSQDERNYSLGTRRLLRFVHTITVLPEERAKSEDNPMSFVSRKKAGGHAVRYGKPGIVHAETALQAIKQTIGPDGDVGIIVVEFVGRDGFVNDLNHIGTSFSPSKRGSLEPKQVLRADTTDLGSVRRMSRVFRDAMSQAISI